MTTLWTNLSYFPQVRHISSLCQAFHPRISLVLNTIDNPSTLLSYLALLATPAHGTSWYPWWATMVLRVEQLILLSGPVLWSILIFLALSPHSCIPQCCLLIKDRVLVSGSNFWEHRLWLSPDRLPRPWRDVGQTLSSFAPVSRIESLSRGLVRSYHNFRSNWELITIKKNSNCFFWRPGCELAWWWLLGRKWAVREQWAPERAVDKMNQLWARVK